MSDTGKQSPLGVNVLSSILQDIGFNINPQAAGYFGASKTNPQYAPGSLVEGTVLRVLTYAINLAWSRGLLTNSTYNNLIAIGNGSINALGNSKPPTYIIEDPCGIWEGQATSGYPIAGNTNQGQDATWVPYDTTNPNASVTQWGYIRLLALQAWNSFNWNGNSVTQVSPEYKDFTSSFLTADGFVQYSNKAIFAMQDSKSFLKGTFSNMNDLISADISGVSLASKAFGQDLINLGRAIDLTKVGAYGLPSKLLQNLQTNNAISSQLALALISAGLSQQEIDNISNDLITPTKEQEQKIYGAFLIITGTSLQDILYPISCKTQGLTTLADLLNLRKLFPISYTTLTVPLYNQAPGPTNSKTYYLIYQGTSVNPQLSSPAVKAQVGTQLIPGQPAASKPITPKTAILQNAIENITPTISVNQITNAYLSNKGKNING